MCMRDSDQYIYIHIIISCHEDIPNITVVIEASEMEGGTYMPFLSIETTVIN